MAQVHGSTYLQLYLCFGNVLLATTTAGNLLCLSDLVPHGLYMVRMVPAVHRGVIAHTSALNASSGYPSTALMLSTELGCTVAKPPDTAHDMLAVPGAHTPQSSEALVGSVCIRPQFARHAVLTYRKTACYHPALQ